jgi:hypothetical protein
MKMLRISALMLAALVNCAYAQSMKEGFSKAECEYILTLSDNPVFPTVCKHRHLQPVLAEITNMRLSLETNRETAQEAIKFTNDVARCKLDLECSGPVFFAYHAHILERVKERDTRAAALLAARRASCPDPTYKKRTASCYIVTAAEYSCSQAVAANTSASFTGSAAICAGAIQTLKNSEIDLLSFGFSIAAGVADDIAQSSFEEGTLSGDVNAALAKLASLGFVVWGLQSCLNQVDYQCGR